MDSKLIGKLLDLYKIASPNVTKVNSDFQDESFIQLAEFKYNKLKLLKKIIKTDRLYLSTPVLSTFEGWSSISTFKLDVVSRFPSGSIVVINNNDLIAGLQVYVSTYLSNPDVLFIVWDFDNHHAIQNSLLLATFCDLYVPAHSENLFALSRANPNWVGPIQCSSIQWKRSFLTNSFATIMNAKRANAPLGIHKPYPSFKIRNWLISKLNLTYNTVALGGLSWPEISPSNRLDEWCSTKCHFVAPVCNDLPIRFFDALITGGIPIVPISLRPFVPVHFLPQTIFYDISQIESIETSIEIAIRKFDDESISGITLRHRYSLENHHLDKSVSEIILKSLDHIQALM